MEKNYAQISRVAVVKKAPGLWKKIFVDLIRFICRYKTYKTVCGNFLKITSLEIFNFRWIFGSEKLLFTTKLLIKLDRQKIKKTLHTSQIKNSPLIY